MTPATTDSIRPYVESLTERYTSARVFALYAPDGYDGAGSLPLPGREVDVRWCPSELAMREALLDERRPERRLLLLTPIEELGDDLASRLVPPHVVRPNMLGNHDSFEKVPVLERLGVTMLVNRSIPVTSWW